jgi:hypothetical protein
MQEDAGDGIPVKFLNLVIRQSVLAYKDFGNYTCVAQTDNSEARAIVELKNIAGMCYVFVVINMILINDLVIHSNQTLKVEFWKILKVVR